MESYLYLAAMILLVLGVGELATVLPAAYTWSVALSIFDVFLFVCLFMLNYAFDEFYLSFNEWVYKVDEMSHWFNHSFSIWLFAKDRKRWAKWSTGFNSFLAIYFGAFVFAVLSIRYVTADVFIEGVLASIFVTGLFAWLFYKYYTSRKPRKPTFDYYSPEKRNFS